MSLALLTILFAILAVTVEVAAIALKLTGINLAKARFQALSALTGTGFTTSESEEVMNDPTRRKIAMVLMVIGHIGLAVIVLTLFSGVGQKVSTTSLIVSVFVAMTVYGIASDRWIMQKLDSYIESTLDNKTNLSKRPMEEVLHLGDGFVVAQVVVKGESPVINKTLAQLHLLDKQLMVLAIERKEVTIHTPKGDDVIEFGDKLVVYGSKLELNKLLERK